MEFTVRREDLVRGLYLVQGVVERRNTLPILSNVLIEPAAEGIALTATDMEVGLRGLITAQVKKKGTVTLNARKLYEITREVTAEEVVLKSVQAGWVEVLAGRSKFKIVSLDAKDFPQLPLGTDAPEGTTISIAVGTLREMIDRTLFAVSSDETRFNLSGVFVGNEDDGVLRMVATDGHRLAMIDRRLPNARLERGAIMPRKGLVEARKLLDSAVVLLRRTDGAVDVGYLGKTDKIYNGDRNKWRKYAFGLRALLRNRRPGLVHVQQRHGARRQGARAAAEPARHQL